MQQYDFSQVIDRRESDCKKYDPAIYPNDVIPMWIADTDFRCPQPIIDALIRRTEHGILGYPRNDLDFAEALAFWLETRFGCTICREWVQYLPGVMPGISFAIQAFSQPGDEVVIQTPIYPPFPDVIRNTGRYVLENPLRLTETGYEIDFENLEQQLSRKKARILLLSNPHNPTGRVFMRKELERMSALCLEYGVTMLSDEIHCDIVYGNNRHIPLWSLSREISDNCVSFYNPSKTFNIAGLRVGAVVCSSLERFQKLEAAAAQVKAYGRTIYGVLGFQTAYRECGDYADQLLSYLEGNIAFLKEALGQQSLIRLIEPQGTYLMWLDCRKLGMDQKRLEEFFFRECRLALNSGVEFGAQGVGFMRMNIACPKSVLEEAVKRMLNAIRKRTES